MDSAADSNEINDGEDEDMDDQSFASVDDLEGTCVRQCPSICSYVLYR